MKQLFSNNATTTTVGSTSSGDTTITVSIGSVFPSPAADEFFVATLIGLDGNGNETSWEIVKCTDRSGNTLTVERAQEGTSAATWPTSTRIELRVTANTMGSIADAEYSEAVAALYIQSTIGGI